MRACVCVCLLLCVSSPVLTDPTTAGAGRTASWLAQSSSIAVIAAIAVLGILLLVFLIYSRQQQSSKQTDIVNSKQKPTENLYKSGRTVSSTPTPATENNAYADTYTVRQTLERKVSASDPSAFTPSSRATQNVYKLKHSITSMAGTVESPLSLKSRQSVYSDLYSATPESERRKSSAVNGGVIFNNGTAQRKSHSELTVCESRPSLVTTTGNEDVENYSDMYTLRLQRESTTPSGAAIAMTQTVHDRSHMQPKQSTISTSFLPDYLSSPNPSNYSDVPSLDRSQRRTSKQRMEWDEPSTYEAMNSRTAIPPVSPISRLACDSVTEMLHSDLSDKSLR